jgi:heavy metal sensor kinase
LWYAVVLAAALGLFGGLVWLSMRARLIDELDRSLADRAQQFEKYFKAEMAEGLPEGQLRDELDEFCQGLPSATYVHLHGASGFVFRYPAGAAHSSENFQTTRRDFSWANENFNLEIVAPTTDVKHTLDLLRLLLWSLLPIVVAVASIGGWWLSGRALKPVQDLTAAAHTISVENLSGRLPMPATDDELARLTQVLNTMLARIESAVRTLSQFAADASHELRTPLSVIRATADLALRRDRSAEAYRESLQEIAAEAARMTALIEDLLTLARSDTGTVEMPLEPVDMRELLGHVVAEMRGLAELRQVGIETSFEDATVSGNRAALHRLFVVLLDNAVKYSRGEVVVRLYQQAVEIQDNGPGISPADLPRIFQRFYRADRSRGSPGHGLGLALAESIARAHGAEISVESKEGEGSTFRVTFPARQADRSANLQLPRVSSST